MERERKGSRLRVHYALMHTPVCLGHEEKKEKKERRVLAWRRIGERA